MSTQGSGGRKRLVHGGDGAGAFLLGFSGLRARPAVVEGICDGHRPPCTAR